MVGRARKPPSDSTLRSSSPSTRRAPVDVFAYRNYRSFLKAVYERKKGQRGGFSYAEFARAAGLRSPTHVRRIIEGERDVGADLATGLGMACGLRGDALAYFGALVVYNQAKTAPERETLYNELRSFGRFRKSHRLATAESDYHSRWFIPAIHELCARPDFSEDPRWLARELIPKISPKEAAHAIATLVRLGLLARSDEGKLTQVDGVVETGSGPLGHHVVQFHRAMMDRAAEALDLIPRSEREIGGLTLCVSEDRMLALKADIEAFRNQLFERYMRDEKPERVVQVNLHMFPLSKRVERK